MFKAVYTDFTASKLRASAQNLAGWSGCLTRAWKLKECPLLALVDQDNSLHVGVDFQAVMMIVMVAASCHSNKDETG